MLKYRRIDISIRERQLSRIDERRNTWPKQTQENVPTKQSLREQQQARKK